MKALLPLALLLLLFTSTGYAIPIAQQTPEPGTITLMGAGLAFIAYRLWRKRG